MADPAVLQDAVNRIAGLETALVQAQAENVTLRTRLDTVGLQSSTKGLGHPDKFGGDDTMWSDWESTIKGYLGTVSRPTLVLMEAHENDAAKLNR